jgi:HK97 family phage major capsid protein
VSYGPEGILRIKGRPVYVTEFNSAIGNVGDIVLADMSEYLFFEKGGVQSASSIHVHFTVDETVFRFVYRCDGMPTMTAPLTPLFGTVNQSPFITLAAR